MDSLPIKQRSILVVDDDETVRLLSREALERTGYRVLVASDGSDVPETVSSERVDLVLLDLEMPGADGLTVCRELRANQETARTPIIIVTSHDDVDSIAAAYEAGATDFVTKPVNWLILGQRVSYVLGASDHRREVEAHREALAEAQRIARLGSWNLDPDTGTLMGSPEFYRVYQLRGRQEGVSLAAFLERIHPDDRDQVRAHLQALEESTQPFTLDHRLHVEDGDERVVHLQGSPRVDPQGDIHWWAGVAQDITERKRAEEQIRFLAFHDSLTGLGNQRLFRQRLLQGVEGARRHRRTLALLFVDLDHFKRINDTLGHSIGDDLLQSAAGRLEAAVRSTDCVARLADEEFAAPVARFGGDEFTILLTEIAEAQDAARVARRVLELMRRPFLGGSQEVTVGASIGIAVWPFDGETADEVIRNADAAMYHAKELGGNTYQFYSAELNADAVERLRIESALRSALGSEGLQIHYQPRVDMRTRRIQSFEALARWHDAESGSIPPGRFIPIAEEAGLIGALGEWVLRQACAQARAWHESGHEGLGVSVNLSPRQFVGGELLDSVERILRETGLEPRFLELEITETALLHDEDGAADLLSRLSKQGVRIALDDFGTGYSSMTYLRRFPVRTLKIDRSFVDGIDKNPADAALTAAILSMAKELGLEVVAEGVETELQRAFLAERGCDQEQGFLFSPPVPAADCTELLSRERKG